MGVGGGGRPRPYAQLHTPWLGPLRCFVGVRELRASGMLYMQTSSHCNQCHSHVQCRVRAGRRSLCLGGGLICAQT